MHYKVALISMPWPLANRASIQLGALKSFLTQNLHDIRVVNIHVYLDVAHHVGLLTYNTIAENTWVAELVYSYISNPELRPQIISSFSKAIRTIPMLKEKLIDDLATSIESLHNRSSIWQVLKKADLVGVSICLSQLSSSLYFIRELKKRFPEKKVVVGGSTVAARLGETLIENVREIDFVVNGEGELPLLNLIKHLKKTGGNSPETIPGLMFRDSSGNVTISEGTQLESLEHIPSPDYDDYFFQLSRLPGFQNLIPGLPVEASRGCWWHQATADAPRKACQFCNLNLQWKGYRYKTAEKVAKEIEYFASRYATTRFFFVDNNLPRWETEKLFDKLEKQKRSYEIFLETRASVKRQTLLRMRRAGVTHVQIGIEGLSTAYLNRIHKGTTAIQNIEIMKNCEELGINNISNLLVGFPGSRESEVEETLRALEYVFVYKPLRIVRFWLGFGSPVYYRAKEIGIQNIRNHPNYRDILPKHLYDKLELLQKDYRFDKKKQQRIWKPVIHKVKEWKKYYENTKKRYPNVPILKFRDARDFLIITRLSHDSPESDSLRLRGRSRDIYRFCETTRSFDMICKQFPFVTLKELTSFLNTLVDKKVMFKEDDKYLSLAVNIDVRRFCF